MKTRRIISGSLTTENGSTHIGHVLTVAITDRIPRDGLLKEDLSIREVERLRDACNDFLESVGRR